MGWIRADEDAITIDVLVVPRASRTQIAGITGDRLKVQLNAPPVDGAANKALIALLAKSIGVAKGSVTIVSGQTSRRKRLRIEGADESVVRALAPEE